jgi:hypothetical protein
MKIESEIYADSMEPKFCVKSPKKKGNIVSAVTMKRTTIREISSMDFSQRIALATVPRHMYLRDAWAVSSTGWNGC